MFTSDTPGNSQIHKATGGCYSQKARVPVPANTMVRHGGTPANATPWSTRTMAEVTGIKTPSHLSGQLAPPTSWKAQTCSVASWIKVI
jgi:hypothetical protein